jgi:hypothetical protein
VVGDVFTLRTIRILSLDNKTFMSRVLDPVYNVSDDASGRLIKLVAFALWMLVQVRLGRIHTIMGLKK